MTGLLEKLLGRFVRIEELNTASSVNRVCFFLEQTITTSIKRTYRSKQYQQVLRISYIQSSSQKQKYSSSKFVAGVNIPSLLQCKVTDFSNKKYFEFEPSNDLLKQAKKATWQYNKEHSKSLI